MRTLIFLAATVALAAVDLPGANAASVELTGRRAVEVPADLAPWTSWVLHNHPEIHCPAVMPDQRTAGEPLCAWPGALVLNATATGARFSQRWQLYADGWVELPGDGQYWPQNTSSGGKDLPVTERFGAPAVWLPAGRHVIEGRIQWQQQPARLPISQTTGMVNLSINGRRVAFPRWSTGTLWLGRDAKATASSEESLRITVYRLLSDGLPQRLETSLRFEVSGQAREVLLARALPDGFLPMSVQAPLPIRLEPDGRLRVQLRPGRFNARITARATSLQDQIELAPGDGEWADDEIWSYQAADGLRVTLPEAGNPVDPAQTGVPQEWRQFAAFRLLPGQGLRVVERSRGGTDSQDNRLSLNRQMWLAFDGSGYTVSDDISGTMRKTWRLDIAQPYQLMSAQQGERSLLVTAGDKPGHSGFEVRSPQLSVRANSRLDTASSALPATGWQQRFEGVNSTVYLPPGYRLLAVSGADSAPNAWLSQWQLLDYFLVLLTAVAAGKLLRPTYGAVALAVMVLTHGEYGAPAWAWIVLLAAVALVRYAPVGRLKSTATALRNLAFVALILTALPFAGSQLRLVVFPQLDSSVQVGGTLSSYSGKAGAVLSRQHGNADMAAAPSPTASVQEMAMEEPRVTATGTGRSLYGEDARLQTGAPLPQWRAGLHRFSIAGPVLPEQTVRLWVLNPTVVGALRALAVVLMALLLWRLATTSFGKLRLPQPAAAASATVLVGAMLSVASLLPAPAGAQTMPPEYLLKELEQRLTARPVCAPSCATWSQARITVRADGLAMEMVVDALAHVAVPVPGHVNSWLPQAITLNGEPVSQVRQYSNSVLHVPVPPGRHTVTLIGALPQRDALSITFPQPPRRVSVTANGWDTAGLVDGRLVGGVLELVRVRSTAQNDTAELEPQQIPPFVTVHRTLEFDVDWQVSTRVVRMAPDQGAFTVRIPLLDGESPISASLPVAEGVVTAGFSAGEPAKTWRSTLARTDTLSLTAATTGDYSEVWSFRVSPLWRANFSGIAAAASEGTAQAEQWQPVYYPRQGERLDISVSQPEGLPGSTLAFDAATLVTRQGRRSAESTLELKYRSTRGGRHTLNLPAVANVTSVTADGATLPLRAQNGALTLPVVPGEHTLRITWQQAAAAGIGIATPQVELGERAGNVQVSLALPADRWPVWTHGPDVGPAVLYWSELLVFLLAALVLARTDITPLKFHHWLILGLGFSTHSWGMLVLVAAWLLALGLTARTTPPANRLVFNARQVGLAALTVVTLATLVGSISFAMLGRPDLHVQGNGSTMSTLRWITDQVDSALPTAGAFTLPLWLYKALILVWALWLSLAMLRWLQWAWRAWSRNGLWRGRIEAPADPPPASGPAQG